MKTHHLYQAKIGLLMKSSCLCTSLAWENTKQIVLSLGALWISSPAIDARGARERRAAPEGSHCTHTFLPLLFSLGIGASWDDPATQAWPEGPCGDLFLLSFGVRKEGIPGLKDGNAHWHHRALPGAASKPECAWNRFSCRDLL